MNFLACDLGGTKVLIGIYKQTSKQSSPKLILKERYSSSEWDSIYEITKDFLQNKCNNKYFPKIACYGIAGPIEQKIAKITNLNWEINEFKLQKIFQFEKVELINDFAVLIYGIPYLENKQFKTLKNNNYIKNNTFKDFHTIVGAGTGLGISRGIISNKKITILPSEGGHAEFAPKTDEEWQLQQWIKNHLSLERVSYERIISGAGLSNVAKWRLDKKDAKWHPFHKILKEAETSHFHYKNLPSKICEMSDSGDLLMLEIKNIWLNIYASFLGDIAIHELCYGGLWIAGGIAPKHMNFFNSDSFLKQFSNKGRLKDIVKSIPIKVILDEDFGLHSAACRAKMLLNNRN